MLRILLLTVGAGVAVAGWPAGAQEPAPKADPAVKLTLGQRSATAEGKRDGLAHTSTPALDVAQPQANAVVVTMSALAAAGGTACEESFAEFTFDLVQTVRVSAPAKLTLEAQLNGLFRASRDGAGTASVTVPAEATLTAGTASASVGFPGRTYCGKDVVSVSDRSPPAELVVGPGEVTLTQRFAVRVSHPKKAFHKNVVTAAFGPDTGKVPDWLPTLDPTRDIPKARDLGFRVVVRADPLPGK